MNTPPVGLTPGTIVWIYHWGNVFPAHVLAVLEAQALVEILRPGPQTSLAYCSRYPKWVNGHIEEWARCPQSYRRLPKKWLQAIVDAGVPWQGFPRFGPVSSAASFLDSGNEATPVQGGCTDARASTG